MNTFEPALQANFGQRELFRLALVFIDTLFDNFDSFPEEYRDTRNLISSGPIPLLPLSASLEVHFRSLNDFYLDSSSEILLQLVLTLLEPYHWPLAELIFGTPINGNLLILVKSRLLNRVFDFRVKNLRLEESEREILRAAIPVYALEAFTKMN